MEDAQNRLARRVADEQSKNTIPLIIPQTAKREKLPLPESPTYSRRRTEAETPSPTLEKVAATHTVPEKSAPKPKRPRMMRMLSYSEKSFMLAWFLDFIIPGTGYMYMEDVETVNWGVIIALLTISITFLAIFYYFHLLVGDYVTWFQVGQSYYRSGQQIPDVDFTDSDTWKNWLIWLTIIWYAVRCFWLYGLVKSHNQVTKESD